MNWDRGRFFHETIWGIHFSTKIVLRNIKLLPSATPIVSSIIVYHSPLSIITIVCCCPYCVSFPLLIHHYLSLSVILQSAIPHCLLFNIIYHSHCVISYCLSFPIVATIVIPHCLPTIVFHWHCMSFPIVYPPFICHSHYLSFPIVSHNCMSFILSVISHCFSQLYVIHTVCHFPLFLTIVCHSYCLSFPIPYWPLYAIYAVFLLMCYFPLFAFPIVYPWLYAIHIICNFPLFIHHCMPFTLCRFQLFFIHIVCNFPLFIDHYMPFIISIITHCWSTIVCHSLHLLLSIVYPLLYAIHSFYLSFPIIYPPLYAIDIVCHVPLFIKSNQIKFYLKSAMCIWKKRKISKKLFARLYSITNNNKLYIDLSILVHHCEIEHDHKWKYILVRFRSTAFYSNLVYILQRHFVPCHYLIWFLNSANVIEFFVLFGRSFHIYLEDHFPLSVIIHYLSTPGQSPLSVIPHCLSFPIVSHPCYLSSYSHGDQTMWSLDCHVLLSTLSNCLPFLILCHCILSVIVHCLTFAIVYHYPLFAITHCLSFPIIYNFILSAIVCHCPLYVIVHCLSLSIVCHWPHTVDHNSLIINLNNCLCNYFCPWTWAWLEWTLIWLYNRFHQNRLGVSYLV